MHLEVAEQSALEAFSTPEHTERATLCCLSYHQRLSAGVCQHLHLYGLLN